MRTPFACVQVSVHVSPLGWCAATQVLAAALLRVLVSAGGRARRREFCERRPRQCGRPRCFFFFAPQQRLAVCPPCFLEARGRASLAQFSDQTRRLFGARGRARDTRALFSTGSLRAALALALQSRRAPRRSLARLRLLATRSTPPPSFRAPKRPLLRAASSARARAHHSTHTHTRGTAQQLERPALSPRQSGAALRASFRERGARRHGGHG